MARSVLRFRRRGDGNGNRPNPSSTTNTGFINANIPNGNRNHVSGNNNSMVVSEPRCEITDCEDCLGLGHHEPIRPTTPPGLNAPRGLFGRDGGFLLSGVLPNWNHRSSRRGIAPPPEDGSDDDDDGPVAWEEHYSEDEDLPAAGRLQNSQEARESTREREETRQKLEEARLEREPARLGREAARQRRNEAREEARLQLEAVRELEQDPGNISDEDDEIVVM